MARVMAFTNALALVMAALLWGTASADLHQEENALLLFKKALRDNRALESWLSSSSACSGSWRGVGCNPTRDAVVALAMEGGDFGGHIPDEIGSLTFLKDLTIKNTKFAGIIPNATAELRSLRNLVLSNNPALSGPFPQWILALPHLEILNLSGNNLTGTLPGCNSTTVTIGGPVGSVTVTVPIPVLLPFVASVNVTVPLVALPIPVVQNISFPNFTNVNPLVWALPPFPLDRPPLNITPTMNWTFPNLNFTLPFDTLPPLPAVLNLSFPTPTIKPPPLGSPPCNDAIVGKTKKSIASARHLTESTFLLWNNISKDSTFNNLPSLQILDLSNNAFLGNLPTDLHTLPNLKHLDLSNNVLTGSIPSTLLKSKVKSINLANNLLSGRLPHSPVANFDLLDVSSNCLTGIVPKKDGKMSTRFTFAHKCSPKSRHCKCRKVKSLHSGRQNRH